MFKNKLVSKSRAALWVSLMVIAGALYKVAHFDPAHEAAIPTVAPGTQASEVAPVRINDQDLMEGHRHTHKLPIEQPVITKRPEPKLAEDQERLFLEWTQKRGFHSERWKSYFNLSDADLKAIAESGDHEALQQLGQRYSYTKPVEALEYLERAAVLDSTYALSAASNVWKNIGNPPQELLDVGLSKDRAVNALSYAFTALLRGDNYMAPDTVEQLTKQFSYSEDQLKKACVNARIIAKDLARRRVAMGLSDFDNSPSPFGVDIGEDLSSIEPCKQNI